jgi:hypothetical protein
VLQFLAWRKRRMVASDKKPGISVGSSPRSSRTLLICMFISMWLMELLSRNALRSTCKNHFCILTGVHPNESLVATNSYNMFSAGIVTFIKGEYSLTSSTASYCMLFSKRCYTAAETAELVVLRSYLCCLFF